VTNGRLVVAATRAPATGSVLNVPVPPRNPPETVPPFKVTVTPEPTARVPPPSAKDLVVVVVAE
jgi:hypothetical protein